MQMPPTDDDVTISIKWMHITCWTNPVCLFIEVDAGSITPTNKSPGTIFLCVIVHVCYDWLIVIISSFGGVMFTWYCSICFVHEDHLFLHC